MDAREDLPRVSVGSVQHWCRLKANYKAAILASLEEHVASYRIAAERDALVIHTNQYIDRAFRMAQPNLRINGQNYESLDESEQNTELFDEALDRRIWSLADTRLQWQKRIADTRRTVPREIEAAFFELLDQHNVLNREEMTTFHGVVINEGDTELDLLDGPLPRYSEIEEGFQKTVALSEELDQRTTSQEQRVARVRSVTGEMKTFKS